MIWFTVFLLALIIVLFVGQLPGYVIFVLGIFLAVGLLRDASWRNRQ